MTCPAIIARSAHTVIASSVKRRSNPGRRPAIARPLDCFAPLAMTGRGNDGEGRRPLRFARGDLVPAPGFAAKTPPTSDRALVRDAAVPALSAPSVGMNMRPCRTSGDVSDAMSRSVSPHALSASSARQLNSRPTCGRSRRHRGVGVRG